MESLRCEATNYPAPATCLYARMLTPGQQLPSGAQALSCNARRRHVRLCMQPLGGSVKHPGYLPPRYRVSGPPTGKDESVWRGSHPAPNAHMLAHDCALPGSVAAAAKGIELLLLAACLGLPKGRQ